MLGNLIGRNGVGVVGLEDGLEGLVELDVELGAKVVIAIPDGFSRFVKGGNSQADGCSGRVGPRMLVPASGRSAADLLRTHLADRRLPGFLCRRLVVQHVEAQADADPWVRQEIGVAQEDGLEALEGRPPLSFGGLDAAL
jgi:hypothetical protein